MGRVHKYWVGLVVLVVGVLLFAAELNWLPFELKTAWSLVWPLLAIVAGGSWLLAQFSGCFSWVSLTLAGMTFAYGLVGMLAALGVIAAAGQDVFRKGWPLLVLAVGLDILFGPGRRRGHGWRRHLHLGPMPCSYEGWRNASDGGAEQEAFTDSAAADTSPSGGGSRGFRGETRVFGEVRMGRRPWDLEPDAVFSIGAGEVEIDLSTARILPGENQLTIQLWAGQVTVYVPRELEIEVVSHLTAGQISVFGDEHDGLGPSVRYQSDGYAEAERKVKIRVEMMFGQVSVRRAR